MTKYVEDVRERIIPELRMQLTESNGAVTLDMWSDDYCKIGSLCVTLHYINSNWVLIEQVLCPSEWDCALCKTADMEFFSKLVYVTNRGSNIIATLHC